MTATHTMQKPGKGQISQADWEAKGAELFGTDKEDWVFVCPSCGLEFSITKAKAELPELKGRGWSPFQEGIGMKIYKILDEHSLR